MPDRRIDQYPVPPDGVEHRHCSDEACNAARTEWFRFTVLPQLKVLFGQALFAVVGAFIGTVVAIVFFVIDAKIDAHTLMATRTLATEYVKLQQHNDDIQELKEMFKTLQGDVSMKLQLILDNQTKIIESVGKKK